MTVQPIRLFGDPVLRTPAAPVVDFDKELRVLVKDLADSLADQGGAVWPRRRSASACGCSPTTWATPKVTW